jgi:hypothetical protein
MGGLRPPREDDPAATLRWVRRIHLWSVPGGLLMAAVLWLAHIGIWWCGLLVTAGSLVSVATMGPALRRAEAHGPNDPATRPERLRRAERITVAMAGAMTVVIAVVALVIEGPGLAITIAGLMLISVPPGLWLARRWTRL